uniref:Uncharacterized protein n=1 Tax=Anguilla anguilla TaxID=7936 RepID=A0A0E9U1Z8_ANGAN
MKSFGKCD